ncbi:DUF5700 domain-containing putative Zn-dependent protease [Psychroserpens damuponensis]|uniref:DUF5700 domain-containing putative Zn-dependent protease n=1 Tax=Psychroserpens damuponensis TaxID=943936 RepID=UPI00058C52EA|nr:DUF5700 domain-containing putative Zn-dependent protease [Psychroserpens damuponensis]
MKKIFVALFVFSTSLTFSQIKINIDKSNAIHTYELLKEKKGISVDSLLKLDGTKKLIEQAVKFDKNANYKNYIIELKNVIAEKSSDDKNSFRFTQLVEKINNTEHLYEYIVKQEDDLNNYLNEKLSKFILPNETLSINAYLLLGGTSDGFSNGATFSIDLGFFSDDIEAMKQIMLHEIFHIVQTKLYKRPSSFKESIGKSDKNLFNLLDKLFREGSASYLANPLLIDEPKSYTIWYQSKYNKNLNRIKYNFQLFQSVFYNLEYDGNANFDDLYTIGFSGMWSSPFYFVGFRMCELIKKHEGEDFLLKYLRLSPTNFFLAYNNYAKLENEPNTYPVFNQHIEEQVNSINTKINK